MYSCPGSLGLRLGPHHSFALLQQDGMTTAWHNPLPPLAPPHSEDKLLSQAAKTLGLPSPLHSGTPTAPASQTTARHVWSLPSPFLP